MNKAIVNDFYKKNYRAPTFTEFCKLGGKYLNCEEYYQLVEEMGYDPSSRRRSVYVVYDTRGHIVFEGLADDVAKRFKKNKHHIYMCVSRGYKINHEYIIKKRGE